MVEAIVRDHGVFAQWGGSHYIAGDATESALLDECMELLLEGGGQGYVLSDTPPPAAAAFGHATLSQPADFGIHPAQYATAMVAASGVGIVEDCAIGPDDITEDRDAVWIRTPRGTTRAQRVLLAANAYVTMFFAKLAGFAPTPARNQVIRFRVEGLNDNALWGDAIHYCRYGYDYWRQFPDGTILLGGGRDKDVPGESTFDLTQNRRVLDYLEGELAPKLAGGRRIEILDRWQGIMGMSPDGVPCAGRAGTSERIWFAAGFSGYGLGLHRSVTDRLARAALNGEDALGPFAPR